MIVILFYYHHKLVRKQIKILAATSIMPMSYECLCFAELDNGNYNLY